MKKAIAWILSLLVSLSLFAEANNLAPNPSFEEGERNEPGGWRSLNPQKTSIDTVTYRSGKRSLSIFRTLSPDGKPILAGWESQPIQVEANKEYILEGWVRTDGASGTTYLSLAWYQDEKFLEEDISEVLQGDNEWRRLYFIAIPPSSKATQLRIRFISQGNSGTAYLDDVSLIAHDAKEYKINLAPNPSFEEGMEDKPYDWEIAREWGDNADSLRSAGTAHSGIYSLSLKVSARGARMAGWKSKGFPVCPGKMYRFTGWAKTKDASGETYLVLAWFNEKGWISNSYHGFFLTGNSDWARLSVSDVPPEDATYAILYLRSDDNSGVAWFDDVRLQVSDAQLSEVAVPNSSFEIESDFWQPWLSEGHCRESRVDDAVAHEGSRSLMISDAVGSVAWQSRGMQLDCNENYRYRVSCWVKTEGKGRALIWIAWFGGGGWIGNSESISAPANSDGWVKLSLIARPPEGARRAVIYLGCEDFQGTVWFDDVKMEQMCLPLDERRMEIEEELPIEYVIAKHYQSLCSISPGRLFRRFEESFLDLEDCRKLTAALQDYFAQYPEKEDSETRLALGIFLFHTGDYEKAVPILGSAFQNLRQPLSPSLYFVVNHYSYWVMKEGRRKELKERRETAKSELSQEGAKSLSEIADGFFAIEDFENARITFEELSKFPPSALEGLDVPSIHYSIAYCLYKEGKYREAAEKLSEFISNYPTGELAWKARLYLAKSLRLSGQAQQAREILKMLWQENLPEELKRETDKEMGKCYLSLKDDPAALEEYRRLCQRNVLPGAIYIGEDSQSLGDWLGKYGETSFILCGIHYGRDIVGGEYEPVELGEPSVVDERTRESLSEEGAPKIGYKPRTATPAIEVVRHIISVSEEETEMGPLLDPLNSRHINAEWNDGGWANPEEEGPGLFVDLRDIPPGIYRLALFMREHEVRLMDDEGRILAVKPRKEERAKENMPNLYECFVVFGPIDLTIHLLRGKSFYTTLSGIFLDKLSPPQPLPQINVGKEETDEGKGALFNKGKEMYEEMRRKWEEDPYWYYQNLDKFKEIIGILGDYISRSPDTTQAILAQFMLWQSYSQLPGEYDEAEEAFARYKNMYLPAEGK